MDSVQVAVRVRPLVPIEIETGCRSCIEVYPEVQQIVTKLKRDKFTFNYVFDSNTPQVDVYETAVHNLVQQLFKGYNVTVLAYGQTGSGKTFSMGTNPSINNTDAGIIPRAIDDIFKRIEDDDEWDFSLSVSFLELYNEQLIDLLKETNTNNVVEIRESTRGILIPGLTQKPAQTAAQVMHCLQQGSLNRQTGATAMNAQSSRSHAIFTIYINQVKRTDEDEAMSAKFHLVDLAGSERSKKTKAEGKRFLEGVNINKELFVLGNVISALCDGATFVNYRDSKLTRLLQDSLGGNALTLMLACVSPADSNLDETVNTLRYADRARKIKNKPVVNQDPQKQEINRLKREIEELQLKLVSSENGVICPPEHQELIEKNKLLIEKNKKLSSALDSALLQTTSLIERIHIAEEARDRLKNILSQLNVTFNNTLTSLDTSLNENQRTNLQSLRSMMDEFKVAQEKSETERMECEQQLCSSKALISSPCVNNENSALQEDEEEDTDREEFVLEQARLHREIQEIDKDLIWKECLVAKLAESNNVEASLKDNNNEDVMELKSQINKLLHEKEELENQLRNQRSSNVDHKLAEQRRKRVKELEDKITTLNKKLMDQDRIIKMKERNEEKIKNLQKDIMSMKQIKVRLINQMKSEGEKFREWRSKREQEMCKLRQQNRQKETKYVKMESYFMKQQNVFKRKLEESNAVIRRLKETLALQQRNAKEKKTLLGSSEKVSQWVNHEFSAMVNALEAERILENLIEDRKIIAKELNKLQQSLSASELNEEEKTKIKSEIKSLNGDLELRSTQIVDLTQKLHSLDNYQENKSKNRYDCIQTMADAKTALKYVFETAHSYLSDLHKVKAVKESALQELQVNYNALLSKLEEKEMLLKEERETLKKAESDHREKVVLLLKRLKDQERKNCLHNDLLQTKIPLQDTTNVFEQDISNEETVQKLQQRIKELENQLENRKTKRAPKKKTAEWNSAITPETRKKFFEEEDDDENVDDDSNDPDWHKTPIYRRIRNLRDKMGNSRAGGKPRASKRSSEDRQSSCNCQTDCSKKVCSCRKSGSSCSSNCGCNKEVCQNKDQSPESSNIKCEAVASGSESDTSFKKPRLTFKIESESDS